MFFMVQVIINLETSIAWEFKCSPHIILIFFFTQHTMKTFQFTHSSFDINTLIPPQDEQLFNVFMFSTLKMLEMDQTINVIVIPLDGRSKEGMIK